MGELRWIGFRRRGFFLVLAIASLAAQSKGPTLISSEVNADGMVAPKAEAVLLAGGDIPGNAKGTAMVKSENGVLEVTLGPLPGGAYRYHFNISGLPVIDPRNPSVSESNNNVWSLVIVPGAEFVQTRDVPHGAVAAITYHSPELKRFRRMHIYTPQGYEAGKDKYPVF